MKGKDWEEELEESPEVCYTIRASGRCTDSNLEEHASINDQQDKCGPVLGLRQSAQNPKSKKHSRDVQDSISDTGQETAKPQGLSKAE